MSVRPATNLTRANFCKIVVFFFCLISIEATLACNNSSSSSSNAGPPAQIAPTGGSGQSASVGTAFQNPLSATVEDSKNNPVSGATVTFTAPASGASATFQAGQTTDTETTNMNGVAMSHAFTANATQGQYTVTASVTGVSTTVSYTLVNSAPAAVGLTSGYGQGTLINTAFAPLEVTVTLQGVPQNGVTVTFTAPSSGASGVFTGSSPLTATATTNQKGVATAPAFTANGTTGVYQVTATASNSPTPATFDLVNVSSTSSPFAAGNYVFSLAGTDANASYYNIAGVFSVDTNGLISPAGGYQTFADLTYSTAHEPIAGGGALVRTSDGDVRIVLNTENHNIGVGGSGEEMFDAALVSGSKAFLTEFDSWATASGELDAQTLPTTTDTPCAIMPCSYAFLVSGQSPGQSLSPFSMGGIFKVSAANTISGGVFDAKNDRTPSEDVGISNGIFTTIDSLGLLQFTLNLDALASDVEFDGYIIDSNHIRLIESGGELGDVTAGIALGQTGSNLGGVCTSGASYVLGLNGYDTNGIIQVAGLFTMPNSTPGSSITGLINYNDLTGTGTQEPLTIAGGSCIPDTTYLGRVSTSMTIADSHVTPNVQLYVTGDTDGDVLALTLDSTDTSAGHGFQQTGSSFGAGSFNGNYAFDATGANKISSSVTSEDEFDAVGALTANGKGAISGSGSVDLNWIFNTGVTTGLSISSGSYTASSNGVFTGGFTGLDAGSSSTSDAFVFYLVDTAGASGSTSRVIAIETDTNQLSLDFLEQQ